MTQVKPLVNPNPVGARAEKEAAAKRKIVGDHGIGLVLVGAGWEWWCYCGKRGTPTGSVPRSRRDAMTGHRRHVYNQIQRELRATTGGTE